MATGVQITGLIKPLNGGSFPVWEDIDGLGGWRSVADVTARNAIPANFRKIGMVVVTEDDGVNYQLVGGITNADWQLLTGAFYQFWQDTDGDLPQRRAVKPSTTDFLTTDDIPGNSTQFALKPQPTAITASLTTLAALAGYPDGAAVFVLDQGETYRLDSTNTFAAHPTLVVAALGGGRWFQRSKSYVVGNFTLWAQSFTFGLVGFTAGQLLATSSVDPNIKLDMRANIVSSLAQQGVTIDSLGNPWVTFCQFNVGYSCQKYLLKDCLVSGAPTPAVVLTPPAVVLTEAGHCAFDRTGTLWVANGTHGSQGVSSFARYGQRAYSKSGNPTPNASSVLFNPGALTPVSSNQSGMAFDAQGNLWISISTGDGTANGNGGIIMLSSDQISQNDTSIVPSKFWFGTNLTATSLGGTNALAFAPNGLLWSCQYGNGAGTVVRAWDPSQPSGNPAAVVTLTCATFAGPYGLVFDAAGNLWVSNGNNNTLMRIPAASLLVSGLVVPDVILTPATSLLTSFIAFPNNPDNSGTLPSGLPR